MIVKKIIYNKGKNEGYFVKTKKGYIQIIIKEGELLKLSNIKKETEIKINEITLKVEEVKRSESYIN